MGTFHATTNDHEGGYETGYDLLNGTNKKVGDLQYWGNAEVQGDYTVYKVTLIFNDIIDAKNSFLKDRLLNWFFQAKDDPKDYNIHIQWTDEYVRKNKK